jgi:repressor LexA
MGNAIESLCKDRNISLHKLSTDTGIPYSCLWDYKIGRSKPKTDKLLLIAKYFGVPLEKLIE